MTRTLAVLRPEPGNAATMARARAAGFATLSLPLFAVRPLDWTIAEPAGHDALILTSANGVRFAGAGLEKLKHLPVLAVGPHTAEVARRAGFDVLVAGGGTAAEIATTAARLGITRALHLAGHDRTLGVGGPITAVLPIYESVALPLDFADLRLLAGTTALLHSARAARRLAELVSVAAFDRAAIAIAAFSPAIAIAAGSGWAAVATAPAPDDDALFAALGALPQPRADLASR